MIISSFLVCSCQSGGKKFLPKERTSTLSEEEKEHAIVSKRKVNIDTLLLSHSIKISVIPPSPVGDLKYQASENIAIKMLEMTCANGIGGVNTNPCIALVASLGSLQKGTTGTAPQKMIVAGTITFKVVNVATGDAFGTASQEIKGVGNSFEEAYNNLGKGIENNNDVQKMLSSASERAIGWYNENYSSVLNKIKIAEGNGDYALALALAESVPEQSKVAFSAISKTIPGLLVNMQKQHAAETLAEMKAAIAESGDELSPKVAGCMKMIPVNSIEYKEAKNIYEEYEKRISASKAKNAEYSHTLQLAEVEASKIKVKYEAKASALAMERSLRNEDKGFFGKIGDRIISFIDNASENWE